MTKEEAIKVLKKNYCGNRAFCELFKIDHCRTTDCEIYHAIKALEAEQPHGHWINERGVIGWTCSNCHDHMVLHVHLNGNYCPNCGAIMDGEIVDLTK